MFFPRNTSPSKKGAECAALISDYGGAQGPNEVTLAGCSECLEWPFRPATVECEFLEYSRLWSAGSAEGGRASARGQSRWEPRQGLELTPERSLIV